MPHFTVAIVGGGLVGALEACLLAKRGCQVTLFERRHDGRSEARFYGRSINLALSHRGLSALERLDYQDLVKDRGLPMKARMVHSVTGKLKAIPYDKFGRSINSIERAGLNNFLLNKAEHDFKVRILFNHKLLDMRADTGELVFMKEASGAAGERGGGPEEEAGEFVRYNFDLILGCDGARSSVRSLMAQQSGLEVSQSFIDHGYLELKIDAAPGGRFKMAHECLHIWPRGDYMMIALPNRDFTFTCTLFLPFAIFEELASSADKALQFFERNFPDAVELIGAQRIRSTLTGVRASSLISVECSRYNLGGRVALLGDAAHAMVPFYGQGMNCGFEDCLVLEELLDEHLAGRRLEELEEPDRKRLLLGALDEYSKRRGANGKAMAQLALYNYIEMRSLVNTFSFAFRRFLDNLLHSLMPASWIPLYTMVTFSRIPVDQCVAQRKRQDRILSSCIYSGSALLLGGLAALGLALHSSRR